MKTVIPGTRASVGEHSLLIGAKGFCMGAADVVPGVSGGTMALILGIYPRLIDAIRAFDPTAMRLLASGQARAFAKHVDLAFLVALGAGIAAALMFFTRVVPLPLLIRSHPEHVYGLFFGLIIASIVILIRELGPPRASDALWLGAGAAAGLVVVNLVPTQTPDAAWFVFLSGALAICAMILPGISGSFILLILQKYAYVFDAIGRLDLGVIVPFGLGAATGLLAFSRVLSWLLHHFYRPSLVVIIGLLVASLWKIWPFQARSYIVVRGKERLADSTPVVPQALDGLVLQSAMLALAGIVAVLALHWLASRRKQSE